MTQHSTRLFGRTRRRPRSPARISVLGLCLLLAGCLSSPVPPWDEPRTRPLAGGGASADATLLTIDGEPLTRGEYHRRIEEKFGVRFLLTEIVTDEIFRLEAARRGIEVADDELRAAADRFIAGMAEERGGIERLEEEYAQVGLTVDELKLDLLPQLRTDLLRRKVTRSLRVIDDRMLRQYYETTYKNKRYETRHIAYGFPADPSRPEAGAGSGEKKLEALQRAQRAADRIRKGADFETIARMESDDKVTASMGGLLGPITEDAPLPPEFKEAIFALQEGEVSDPVENPLAPGFHIFQVTRILPGESFVDCEEAMREDLQQREPPEQEIAEAARRLGERVRIEWSEDSPSGRPRAE